MNPISSLNLAAGPMADADLYRALRAGNSPQKIPETGVQSLGGIGESALTAPAGPSSDVFSSVLGKMVREVNASQATAGNVVEGMLAGKDVSLHQAMIAMEEASVSFQLMVEVRNRLLESYQELMRMQI